MLGAMQLSTLACETGAIVARPLVALSSWRGIRHEGRNTANLRTNNPDFRGIDSSIILMLRGGILMSTGDFPKVLSHQILVGIILVGRLGVT